MRNNITTAAAGPSNWIMVNHHQNPFSLGFVGTVQGGSTLTFKVQSGHSDGRPLSGKITRSTTTATVVFAGTTNHGLTTSDSLVISGFGAPFDGTFAVASVVDGTSVTYTVADSGATAASAGKIIRIFVADHASVTGKTATTEGSYTYPINFIRSNITSYTSGALVLSVTQAA